MSESTFQPQGLVVGRATCIALLLASTVAWAQGLRPAAPILGPLLAPAAPAASAATSGARSSDFIVAVVDSEPITNQELQQQVEQTVQQMQQQQGGFVPRREVLVRQVLERLIDERAQDRKSVV